MTQIPRSLWKNFWKDDNGNIAVWQRPNLPLMGWLSFKGAALVTSSIHLRAGFELLSSAFIFTWAYLELTKGISPFRKFLGAAIFVLTIIGYFKR